LDAAAEILVRPRIDPDAHRLVWFDETEPRLGHIDAHPEVLRQNQRGNLAVRAEHVADFDAEHFKRAIAGRGDLHFAKLRVDLGEPGARLLNLLGARAFLELLVTLPSGFGAFFQSVRGAD